MKVIATSLPGVCIIETRVFRDARGLFLETFNAERFAEHGLPATFRQDNHSRSARGVLRGLHYQLHRPQGKLVGVVQGEVFDVAVDIRRGSPTFGRWFGTVLSADSPRYVWIPPGFAHGFCVLSETADFVYKCTDVYAPDDDRGVLWSDREVAISWPLTDPTLSEKDRQLAPLSLDRDDLPGYTA